ncbi:MAG: hypothetical protein P4K83_12725 [Terracidiphilus sp.]|nr:hypothetical protein [Terracidiphilus sp.]
MNLGNCTHKEELSRILARGAWPLAASAELQAHVAECRDCSARLRLTLGLRALRSESIAAAPQLPPGLIWWRAQIRRRHEAIERVGRPLIAGQILALAAGLCILCIAWLPQRHSFQPSSFQPSSFSIWWANLWSAAAPTFGPAWRWPLIAAASAMLVLTAVCLLDLLLERASNRR